MVEIYYFLKGGNTTLFISQFIEISTYYFLQNYFLIIILR